MNLVYDKGGTSNQWGKIWTAQKMVMGQWGKKWRKVKRNSYQDKLHMDLQHKSNETIVV